MVAVHPRKENSKSGTTSPRHPPTRSGDRERHNPAFLALPVARPGRAMTRRVRARRRIFIPQSTHGSVPPRVKVALNRHKRGEITRGASATDTRRPPDGKSHRRRRAGRSCAACHGRWFRQKRGDAGPSVAVLSLAWRSPSRRFWRRVISVRAMIRFLLLRSAERNTTHWNHVIFL